MHHAARMLRALPLSLSGGRQTSGERWSVCLYLLCLSLSGLSRSLSGGRQTSAEGAREAIVMHHEREPVASPGHAPILKCAAVPRQARI